MIIVNGYEIRKGADLRVAYLRRADLHGVDLYEADLSAVNLNGAKGWVKLPVSDPRLYEWVAISHEDGWRIKAGCRWFTLEKAREHWLSSEYDGPDEVKETVKFALDWLETRPLN